MKFFIAAEAAHRRLDVWLNEQLADKSRSHVQKLIADGLVTVDGAPVKPCGGRGSQ